MRATASPPASPPSSSRASSRKAGFRYTALASEISERIRSGDLRPGDRLPSVRRASRLRGLSPNTVLEAYHLLEDRGEIRARPRSGYFIAGAARRAAVPEPEPIEAAFEIPPVAARAPARLTAAELALRALAAFRLPGHVHFSGSSPHGDLFPLGRLARSLKGSLHRLDLSTLPTRLPEGNGELRRFLVRRALEWGFAGSASELVITAGTLEGMNLCLDAVTRPGDLIAVEAAASYAQRTSLERRGLRSLELPTDLATGVSLGALERALRKHSVRACLLMPNFQNPLGFVMPEAAKRELVALLARHDVPLIENDVYGELHFGGARPVPAKAFDRKGLVLHCASFSKCLAPGYSVGWVLAGRFAGRVQLAKWTTNAANGVITQAALVEYLRHGGYEHHLRRLRRTLAALHDRALATIERHFPRDTRIRPVSGGFTLWLELPEDVEASKVYALALRERITVAPGPLFSASRRHRSALRLNFAQDLTPRRDAALATLGRIAASLA